MCRFCTYAREFAEQGKHLKAVDFVNSLEVANQMYATLGLLLEKYHILICPTNALPAVPADFAHTQGTVTINDNTVNPMLGWVMTTPLNTLSRCPMLTFPTGTPATVFPPAFRWWDGPTVTGTFSGLAWPTNQQTRQCLFPKITFLRSKAKGERLIVPPENPCCWRCFSGCCPSATRCGNECIRNGGRETSRP